MSVHAFFSFWNNFIFSWFFYYFFFLQRLNGCIIAFEVSWWIYSTNKLSRRLGRSLPNKPAKASKSESLFTADKMTERLNERFVWRATARRRGSGSGVPGELRRAAARGPRLVPRRRAATLRDGLARVVNSPLPPRPSRTQAFTGISDDRAGSRHGRGFKWARRAPVTGSEPQDRLDAFGNDGRCPRRERERESAALQSSGILVDRFPGYFFFFFFFWEPLRFESLYLKLGCFKCWEFKHKNSASCMSSVSWIMTYHEESFFKCFFSEF